MSVQPDTVRECPQAVAYSAALSSPVCLLREKNSSKFVTREQLILLDASVFSKASFVGDSRSQPALLEVSEEGSPNAVRISWNSALLSVVSLGYVNKR